ncbi:[Fe-Fe] hydrogenase large subunit C-terminal domain-containing protein [Spirochaetia bacterium 38H-sp]|uniref:[Fe-Fe] hydrogenase large subunit C-terminal domain-containing protein n=1 Tax=Rarispira pelagica TaxID=3141764 RepID=A0ABU9UBH8_9SPIR
MKQVIKIDKEKCVNCHRCISVCPVKFCNDGAGDSVHLNPDLCIACGACIKACSHGARYPVDDFDEAMELLAAGEKVVAIVAPSVAANFPDSYLSLNSWLKEKGVAAVFDVSFGAELCVRSYLEYLKTTDRYPVIAQPCPVIVNYIEHYQPTLIPYLAPAHSPMMHTIKMIRTFYKKYAGHRVIAISPCVAKKHEFVSCGEDVLNVTMFSLAGYLSDNSVDLSLYPKIDYDNDPAERAVLFSSPGGLTETVIRENPSLRDRIRKIEGAHTVFSYLNELTDIVDTEYSPVLVDCLNCELGCNGGTGTLLYKEKRDVLEYKIKKRAEDARKRYLSRLPFNEEPSRVLKNTISKYWQPGIYMREYKAKSEDMESLVLDVDDSVIVEIYKELKKDSEADIKNCSACGYRSCREMAIAIYNGLNRADNCYLYRLKQQDESRMQLMEEKVFHQELIMALHTVIEGFRRAVSALDTDVMLSSARAIETARERLLRSVEEMVSALTKSQINIDSASSRIAMIKEQIDVASVKVEKLRERSSFIADMVKLITEVADRTKLLALNASIEAAHVGELGKGFGVIAGEIRKLAHETIDSSKAVKEVASEILEDIREVEEYASREKTGIRESTDAVTEITSAIQQLLQESIASKELLNRIELSTRQQEDFFQNTAAIIEQMLHTAEKSLESRGGDVNVMELMGLAEQLGVSVDIPSYN